MAYLSDTAKQHIKDIIARWDELGHAPSHKEFNSDPKVTNAMASCFGSYDEAVKEAKYYYNHPEQRYKLDPPPPPPPKAEVKGGKKRRNTTKVKTIQEPCKPLEQVIPLKVGETRVIPKVALKTPLAAPEEPKKESEELVVTPIETTLEKPEISESAPPPEPEITPISEPQPAEEPIKEPEIEALEEPEETPAEPESTEVESKATPEEETDKPEETEDSNPVPTKEVVRMSQTIINLIGKPVILVNSSLFNKALNGIKPDISPLQSDGTAIAMKAEITIDSHIFEASDDLIEIPIASVYGQPSILKDKRVHSFPDPKEGTLLLVSREVIDAACNIGRDTDDLIYPLDFAVYNGCMYCKKLGRI